MSRWAETPLPPISFLHSRDDEEIPSITSSATARFSDADFRALDGCGRIHDRGELTEIVEAIRRL